MSMARITTTTRRAQTSRREPKESPQTIECIETERQKIFPQPLSPVFRTSFWPWQGKSPLHCLRCRVGVFACDCGHVEESLPADTTPGRRSRFQRMVSIFASGNAAAHRRSAVTAVSPDHAATARQTASSSDSLKARPVAANSPNCVACCTFAGPPSRRIWIRHSRRDLFQWGASFPQLLYCLRQIDRCYRGPGQKRQHPIRSGLVSNERQHGGSVQQISVTQ
jgi:hypothetical protein